MRTLTVFAAVVLFGSVHASPDRITPPTAFRAQISGHGRAMILIPGLSSSSDTWKGTVARYQSQYTCHALTLAGFAGVPAINAPLLSTVRAELAAYIEQQHLDKPVIVGHSLGGNVALDLAARRPDLVGPLVVVDSLPFYAGAWFRVKTLDEAKPMIAGMHAYQAALTREQYDQSVRSTAATKFMVTSPADLKVLTEWGLASDPRTVADAMSEILSEDLRADLGRITSPTLLLGTWVGLREQVKQAQIDLTREEVVKTFKGQFEKLPRLRFAISDTARHFIMFDDPAWFFEQVDAFLTNPAHATEDRGFAR